jgi:riboflavin kinase / FMN adenylyltransferase
MVVKGRGEGGSRLDIPTANLLPSEHAALPAPGVYAGRAILRDGSTWSAGISVGVPPTFPQSHHVLEAHLLGFEGDLLHQDVVLEFNRRLRPQRAFESMTDLAESIRADLDEVRENQTEGSGSE